MRHRIYVFLTRKNRDKRLKPRLESPVDIPRHPRWYQENSPTKLKTRLRYVETQRDKTLFNDVFSVSYHELWPEIPLISTELSSLNVESQYRNPQLERRAPWRFFTFFVLPRQRQTLFFTATWPQSVRRLAAEPLGRCIDAGWGSSRSG